MGVIVNFVITALKYTLFNIYFLIVVIPLILLREYNRRTVGKLVTQKRLDGKTVIVTGGNTGIGYETAKELAYRGARVILACKNVGSGYLAKNAIIKETRNDDVEVYRLDLSSLRSIRIFAREMIDKERRLDILIFVGGIGFIKHKETSDKIPLTWQVNCISSFLLSNLLLDLMKKTAPGKIIFISSVLHHLRCFKVENIGKPCNAISSYCNTKFATILMANYMARKLEGTGITVNTVNPGLVNVPIIRRVQNSLIQFIFQFIMENYGKSAEEGGSNNFDSRS
ncbi:hypothetical protein O3M35_012667 [Rhynocoris fuscipes]|uniref:Uncharacterized protein n=1 Tax=Rhynocoris fuscipes TaxID=488301 RepID=A0AAW1CWM1_9HEMI